MKANYINGITNAIYSLNSSPICSLTFAIYSPNFNTPTPKPSLRFNR